MALGSVILLFGRHGQVGHALESALSSLGTVAAVGRADCDLTDPGSVTAVVRQTRPHVIVNAAAYTAVDKAENDRDLAFRVNGEAPGFLAELATQTGTALVHYSTDYVFDGKKLQPYLEDDPVDPLSVYGASKLAGEAAIRAALAEHLILRTSWVFSTHGANFLKTMLRLAANRDSLSVVSDQIGAPTGATVIAEVTARLVERILREPKSSPFGTYHLTAAGETSWHGYARYAIERARRLGFPIQVSEEAITAIATADFPTPARRPVNSRLDTAKLRQNFGIVLPPWQEGVMQVLEVLARS